MHNQPATAMGVGDVESVLRNRFDAGDLEGMIALAIKRYGSELYGFLRGLTRDRVRADDLFAITCERVWRFLPSFRWDSSFRVWAYTIARNEFLRDVSRVRREAPLSEVPAGHLAVERTPSSTSIYDSEIHDRFAKVREQLPPDDHVLLGLRLDREMSWDEIAKVLTGDGAKARDAAMLRKRYERLKIRLREMLAEYA